MEHCPTCGHKVNEYLFHFDYTDAKAIIAFGQIVDERVASGMSFTEANKVNMALYNDRFTKTQFDRKTQLKYLGLIAKIKNEKGAQVSSTWCLTSWGVHLLNGGGIYRTVRVKEKQIMERSTDLVTLHATISEKEPEHKPYPWKTACFTIV